MPALANQPLPLLAAWFAAAAALVWWSGVRLPARAAAIGRRTGIGQAFAGMLLLGGITTLPELSTVLSAGAMGAGRLAINNALGSAAFNIMLLATADAAIRRGALTAVIASPATLLQAVLGMLLLAAVAAGIVAGDRPLVPGVGVWSTLIFAGCLIAMRIAARYETRPAWTVVAPPPAPPEDQEDELELGTGALVAGTAGLAALILVGGIMLATSADAIAARTEIGEGLIGFVLLALATSLPELSTIVSAARRGRYELAVGDIFGANLFNVAMIFLLDLVHAGPPILGLAGPFEAVAALLALVLTGVFLIGLLERHDRTLFRMGYDSIAAIVIYGAAMAYLSSM